MSTFTEETHLYEILVRVQADGAVSAQYQTLSEVKKDGVTISATVSDVAPLLSHEGQAFAILEDLIGASISTTAVVNAQLSKDIRDLEAKIAELELTNSQLYEQLQKVTSNGGI